VTPFAEWIGNQVVKGSKILDIGCGDRWYWKDVEAHWLGLDAWEKFEPDFLVDLEKADLPYVKADAVLMADFLEHMTKERGKVILDQAKRLAPTVMVLTPLRWDDNSKSFNDESGNYYRNKYVLHRSLWSADDFPGFEQNTVACPGYYLGVYRG